MTDTDDDLRATAEQIITDADRLASIEEEKLTLEPADPRMVVLSEAARAIAKDLVPKTLAESELAAEAQS
jgi:hypothetical protein